MTAALYTLLGAALLALGLGLIGVLRHAARLLWVRSSRHELAMRHAIHAEQEAAKAYEGTQADDDEGDDVSEAELLAISIAGLELLMGDDASACAWRHKGRVVVLARSDGAGETLWRFADMWQAEMVKAVRRGWA